MEIRILEPTTGSCMHKTEFPVNCISSNSLQTERITIEKETYTLNLEEVVFEGIHISKLKVSAGQSSSFIVDFDDINLDFLYCLEGQLLINDTVPLVSGQQFISSKFLNNKKLTVMGNAKIILMQLSDTYFYKINSSTIESEMQYFREKEIPYEILPILSAISDCKYAKRVQKIFLESKIYELIFSYLNRGENLPVKSIKKEDLDKIFLVKKIIDQDTQTSFSLLELARRAGINDFKLKKGFKELTGETVFSYITKIRMQKAYYFLAHDKMAVNEVAYLIGYKNAQHFTAAFKRYYQVLPGSLNRSSFSKSG